MACPFVRENISNMYWDVQDGAQSFWTRNHRRTFAHTSVVVLGKSTSTFKGARPHFGGNTKRVRETKRQRARENSRMIGWYKRDSVRTACKNLMVILSYVYLFTPLAKNRVVSSPPTINQPRRLVIPTPCASKKNEVWKSLLKSFNFLFSNIVSWGNASVHLCRRQETTVSEIGQRQVWQVMVQGGNCKCFTHEHFIPP